MMMCKLNVLFVLLIINLIYIIDGKYEFKKYNYGQLETEIRCSGNISRTISNIRKQARCMPRITLMKLDLDSEYSYYPNVIPLQRCHGNCPKLSCLPIQTKRSPIYLERTHFNSSYRSCVSIDVEEHVQCKCACEVMKEHCNSKQVYQRNNCNCKCINEEEKRECMKKSNMIWDPQNCKCMCNNMEETCSSGLMWIREKCACAKVIMMDDK